MNSDVSAVALDKLSNSFMGDTGQICVVSNDLERTIDGFVKMGVGPWAVYTYGPGTISETTYMGENVEHTSRVGLCFHANMFWEIIQPVEGPSIYRDFLEKHGEGVQHVVFECNDESGKRMPFDERIQEFERRGCKVIQSGLWLDTVRFAYIGTEDAIGTTIEIHDEPEDFSLPMPEQWIPGPPPM